MNVMDINKVIDDAMLGKDREVCIFISDIGTTVKVKPLSDSDPRWIIRETKKPGRHFPVREFECSECHTWVKEPMPYCGFCGEKLRLPTEEEHKEKATEECRGDCDSCDDTDCQNTPDEEATDE